MTLEQFGEIARSRPPTPEELLAFVRGMGWQVRAGGVAGAAVLHAPRGGEVALALARMLGREPYRTEVLKLTGLAAPPRPREWRFAGGTTQAEGGELFAKYGAEDKDSHPGFATHWRFAGEDEWQEIRR